MTEPNLGLELANALVFQVRRGIARIEDSNRDV
jgi:hypothetical protein